MESNKLGDGLLQYASRSREVPRGSGGVNTTTYQVEVC